MGLANDGIQVHTMGYIPRMRFNSNPNQNVYHKAVYFRIVVSASGYAYGEIKNDLPDYSETIKSLMTHTASANGGWFNSLSIF